MVRMSAFKVSMLLILYFFFEISNFYLNDFVKKITWLFLPTPRNGSVWKDKEKKKREHIEKIKK
jgi:hypothetical protein